MKEEIKKIESSNYSYHSIDYKLKKLRENLIRIQNSEFKGKNKIKFGPKSEFSIDSQYLNQLDNYLEDSISNIY